MLHSIEFSVEKFFFVVSVFQLSENGYVDEVELLLNAEELVCKFFLLCHAILHALSQPFQVNIEIALNRRHLLNDHLFDHSSSEVINFNIRINLICFQAFEMVSFDLHEDLS